MTEEDFLAWREHPVTHWFLSSLTEGAAFCERVWFTESWGGGQADERRLHILKAKADAYTEIANASFSTIEGLHE